MEGDKKLETLQEEIKLLKGELKQSLASVRDYLLNMELPSSEFSTILAALGGDGEQKITLKGNLTAPPQNQAADESHDELTEMEEEQTVEDAGEPVSQTEQPTGDTQEDEAQNLEEVNESTPEEAFVPEDIDEEEPGAAFEEEEGAAAAPEMEDKPMDYDNTAPYVNAGIPKVNTLANLLNWVAAVKKDIGREQIPVFLEVYGLSGHLSPELKEVIIHLAEMTENRSESSSYAEIWSQAMLSLHGILLGGDAPRFPWIPNLSEAGEKAQPAEDDIIEVDKSREKQIKLKLVLPTGDGKSQEFCLDLTPETDSNVPT